MTQPVNAIEVFIPPPIAGMNSENQFADAQQGFARLLHNVIIDSGRIVQRFAQTAPSSSQPTGPGGAATLIWADRENQQFLWSDGVIRNTFGTTVYTGTILTTPFETRFRNQIYLSVEGEATIKRSGTTWAVFPFTLSSLTSSTIKGGLSFKSRVYFWGDSVIEYGGVDSIAGNTVAFNITSLLDNSEILFCRECTITQGLGSDVAFCIYAKSGLTFVYVGDYPGSTNWQLIGKYKTSPPLGRFSFAEVDGNVFVMTQEIIYSTRDLMSGGTEQARATAITNNVSSLYRSMAAGTNILLSVATQQFGHYLRLHDALIFNLTSMSRVFGRDDALPLLEEEITAQLIYFRKQQAWALWTLPQFNVGVQELSFGSSANLGIAWPMHKSIVLYASAIANDTLVPNGSEIAVEQTNGIEMEWRTPYFAQRQLQNCRCLATRPLFSCSNPAPFPTSAAGINGSGVIGDFTDTVVTPTFVQFKMDQFAELRSLQKWAPIKLQDIYDPYIPIGLQARFASAVVRVNDFDQDDTVNAIKNGAFYGIFIYVEPGGI